MTESRPSRRGSPSGWRRFLFRMPTFFYRLKLGFLLGHRFVMIEHVGRRSGQVRRTVLEVVLRENGALYVAAAWGSKSDWYQNILKTPAVGVHISVRSYRADAVVVDQARARGVLDNYAGSHPRAFNALARYMLDDPGPTIADKVTRLVAAVPIVELARR